MSWRQRVRDVDERVNRRIGATGTLAERAAFEERWWWVGLVGYIVILTLLLVLAAVADSVSVVAGLVPAALLLFRAGFFYNERLRSLGTQSRLTGLWWRSHESDERAGQPVDDDDEVSR